LASPKSYDEASFGPEALVRATTQTKPLETTGKLSGI
jgi:hypothetical protein